MPKQIRVIEGSDYAKFCTLANSAFEGLNADEWLEEHIKETPKEHLYGLFKGNQLHAGMRTFDFEMNYDSTPVQAGGVGMLAVDMLHKKEKNAYQLMQYFFKLYAEKQVKLVMLHPFKASFYKKMGFGMGTKTYQFYIQPKEFPDFSKKSHLKEITSAEKGELLDCYNRIYAQTHGMTRRFAYDRELNRPFWFGRVIGYVEEGKVKGYFVYSMQGKDLHIHELFFEAPEVIKEFSTFLHSQSDQIERVILNSNFDEIVHFVNSSETGETSMIDFPSATDPKPIAQLGMGVMYRLINCRGFFKELKDKNHQFNPGVTLAIKLTIADDFYPDHARPFILDIQEGKIENIREDGLFEVEVKMNIAEFSSLVMGVESVYTYLRWGLMEISNEKYKCVLQTLFHKDCKPMNTKAF
ncbi:GNAT family N-acetyltransferase [Halobacillus rhizosphaerae]|uniref:GNAT family N-acetyltransferase n=1 Tax=Halobacillus rhizosphaerae TaxID=3064889 RepID=UPI00398B07EF